MCRFENLGVVFFSWCVTRNLGVGHRPVQVRSHMPSRRPRVLSARRHRAPIIHVFYTSEGGTRCVSQHTTACHAGSFTTQPVDQHVVHVKQVAHAE